MSLATLVARLQSTLADPAKAGTGSVWDHIGASARGMIATALALGASEDLVFTTLVNSDYGSGSHDGGQTAMFELLARLRGNGGGAPAGGGADPSNGLPQTFEPSALLERANEGITWAGNYVGDSPSRKEKLAFYSRVVGDPGNGLSPDVLFVLVMTNRLLENPPMLSAVEDLSKYAGMTIYEFAAKLKQEAQGGPSL